MERTHFPFLIKYPLPDLPPRGKEAEARLPHGGTGKG